LFIFVQLSTATCANGSKTCAFARKINAFVNKLDTLIREVIPPNPAVLLHG
jgi:hypothetical protein